MEDALKEYMFKYDFIKDQFQIISRVCMYLNREIQVHEIGQDYIHNIRNMNDAYNYIIEWNTQMDNQIDIYNELVKSFNALPTVDFFKVKFETKQENNL